MFTNDSYCSHSLPHVINRFPSPLPVNKQYKQVSTNTVHLHTLQNSLIFTGNILWKLQQNLTVGKHTHQLFWEYLKWKSSQVNTTKAITEDLDMNLNWQLLKEAPCNYTLRSWWHLLFTKLKVNLDGKVLTVKSKNTEKTPSRTPSRLLIGQEL